MSATDNSHSYLPCAVEAVPKLPTSAALANAGAFPYDAICLLDRNCPAQFADDLAAGRQLDAAFDQAEAVSVLRSAATGQRVIYAPVGELGDFDDVRAYERAAGRAVARALKAGAQRPVLVLPAEVKRRTGAEGGRFAEAALQSVLGALAQLYVPIQYREDVPEKRTQCSALGIFSASSSSASLDDLLTTALRLERARHVARDLGGGDPERMSPPNCELYVRQVFANSPVRVRVVSDPAQLQRDYPLFAAVNRAAASVPRHAGRIVFLEYTPPQAARKTLLLVGKGVTYDTGGADIKAGGVMAGMSRDKCGAAAVAGFLQYVAQAQPKDVAVVGVLCLVRNSVGEECYVSDEMVVARSGQRVRVGNTDAEGRMAMADALYEMKERAVQLPDPHLFTVATLTGHAWLAVGVGYSIALDNGPARAVEHAQRLKRCGDQCGEPFEVSTVQREDFAAHRGQCLGEDALQANNLPSSRTPRGHQTPAAFLMMAAGLTEHGTEAAAPLKYTHLDIAGSCGDVPHPPTGAPILALARAHLE